MLLRLRFAGAVLSLVACWGALVLYLEWSSPVTLLRHYRSPAAAHRTSTTFPRADAAPCSTTRSPVTRTSSGGGNGGAVQVLVVGDSVSLGGLVATVNSVLLHSRRPVAFHLLTTAEERAHLRTWIESTKLHTMTYTILPAASKARLRLAKTTLPQLLPAMLDGPALYLEPDLIVQGDVGDLVSVQLGNGRVGAFSRDCSGRTRGWAGPWDLRLATAGIDPTACLLATGAFVVDLGAWRARNVTQRLHAWLDMLTREPLVGPHAALDEVDLALSIVLHDQVSALHPLWHVQHLDSGADRHSKQLVERARLVRWSGRAKPWLPRAAHTELWERYFVPDPTGQFRLVRKRG